MRCAIVLFFVTMASSKEFFFLDRDYSRTPLGNQIDMASVKMLKEAYLASDESNVVTSPLGVCLLLSLYSSGTEGKSREEIMTLLGASDYKDVFDSYSGLSDKFASMDPNYLNLANKVYVAKGYTPSEELSNAARSYHSEVDSIDFSDPDIANGIVLWLGPLNNLKLYNKSYALIISTPSSFSENIALQTGKLKAAEKTKGHIKDPVSEQSLNKDAAVALFNVIFFQGHWHVPFSAKETKEKDFHVNKSLTVKKPMMHLKESLFYHEDNELGARMIELPYQETGFRMIVILPNEIEGLASVLEKVEKKGLLEDVFELMPAGREINLYMPKFDIKSKLDYKSILPKLGVKGIFEEGAPGIVRERSVVVSEIFQEAFVKVDEEGATAGAFTGLVAVPISSFSKPPKPMDFIVDHPFLFAILHKDVVLFAGTYSQ